MSQTRHLKASALEDLLALAEQIVTETETCVCPDKGHENRMHDLAHDLVDAIKEGSVTHEHHA